MPTYTSTTGATALLDVDTAALVVEPVSRASVAIAASTRVITGEHSYRIPKVLTDPTAAWVAEGAEITPSDMVFDEILVVPTKIAGLSVISHEMAADSSPAATAAIGQGLARNIAISCW